MYVCCLLLYSLVRVLVNLPTGCCTPVVLPVAAVAQITEPPLMCAILMVMSRGAHNGDSYVRLKTATYRLTTNVKVSEHDVLSVDITIFLYIVQ